MRTFSQDEICLLDDMNEAVATFTKPVLFVAEYAVRLKVAKRLFLIKFCVWLTV